MGPRPVGAQPGEPLKYPHRARPGRFRPFALPDSNTSDGVRKPETDRDKLGGARRQILQQSPRAGGPCYEDARKLQRSRRKRLTVTVCGEPLGWVKRAKPRFGGATRRSLECPNHSRAVRAARAAPPELESAPLGPPYGLSACPPPQSVTVRKKTLSFQLAIRRASCAKTAIWKLIPLSMRLLLDASFVPVSIATGRKREVELVSTQEVRADDPSRMTRR
jgi:hypothetical protein